MSMQKIVRNILIGGLISVFSLSIVTSLSSCNHDYYASINDSMTGEELRSSLEKIITHTNQVSYASLASVYRSSDADLTTISDFDGNPTNVILFYTGESRTWVPWGTMGTSAKDITREHIWPQSRFRIYGEETPGPYSDPHMVRPCQYSINEMRSNYFYGEEGNNVFDPADIPSGDETYRGDIARILFYCVTRYDKLELVDNYTAGTGDDSYQMGKLSDLLKWNLEYPVADREMQRNEAVYEIQGNRNPFIDHPEYACRIFGTTNDSTRSICGL